MLGWVALFIVVLSEPYIYLFSLNSEFYRLCAVAENDMSKKEVLDLGTDRESFVADGTSLLCVSDVGLNKFECTCIQVQKHLVSKNRSVIIIAVHSSRLS